MVKEVLMIPHQTHTQTTSLSSALRAITKAAPCTLPLSACGIVDNWQSGAVDAAASMPAEKVMSAEYEVGPDGKLLNPNRDNLPDVPQKPAAMNKNNAEGAEAFAKHFIATVHYTWLTQDTSFLKALSDPECEWCLSIVSQTRAAEEAGAWTTGADYTLEDVTLAFKIPDHPGMWHKEVLHKQGSYVY